MIRLFALLALTATTLSAQEIRELQFQSTDAEFLNPERGFYRYRTLTEPSNFAVVRDEGQSIIYGRVEASDFRDRPLDDPFLEKIQAGFDEARKQGLKVKFRLAYNNGFEADAPKDVILNHIQQLKPVWEKNKDVLFHMDAGFIGAWGEWHGSTNGLENATDRREILFAILDALPADRTVGIRTPHYKREAFNGSQLSDTNTITAENAFDGSRLTRVGHLNDCFLSSPDDVGTYRLLNNNWPLERELDYIGTESLYVPFGGETCALHERSESTAAIAEMEKLHIDYLNLDYHPDVINRWKDEGKFDEIQRRLGYRFELKSAELPEETRPGGLMSLEFEIENVGFGELFNPRNVEVALRNNDTGKLVTAPLKVDPRRWSGGETHEIKTTLAVPESLTPGVYSVGLRMPDIEPSLREDVRYAIRFANEEVWEASSGINVLDSNLVVSKSSAGKLYDQNDEFKEVVDPTLLNLKGDFNSNGVLDAEDIDMLLSSDSTEFDLNGDLRVDIFDRDYWVSELAQTHVGDVDLDGLISFADFLQVAQEFGSEGGWSKGNFDFDGKVGFTDFLLLSSNFGQGTLAATVPEPTTSWRACWAALFLLRLRCKKRQNETS